jgi:hypothetical protein
MDRPGVIDATTVAQLGDLLTVWAHPDDETYLAGGLMAAAIAAGASVTCVVATSGERGGPPDRQAELSWWREEELTDALSALGVRDLVLLRLPDGGCSALDPSSPVATIAGLIDDRAPDTVITFGPDGHTGHADPSAPPTTVVRTKPATKSCSAIRSRSSHAGERRRVVGRRRERSARGSGRARFACSGQAPSLSRGGTLRAHCRSVRSTSDLRILSSVGTVAGQLSTNAGTNASTSMTVSLRLDPGQDLRGLACTRPSHLAYRRGVARAQGVPAGTHARLLRVAGPCWSCTPTV